MGVVEEASMSPRDSRTWTMDYLRQPSSSGSQQSTSSSCKTAWTGLQSILTHPSLHLNQHNHKH
ncbi:hypothetical protein PGT21_006576 [Puccinia graminis f. sp. tritici]|uniref:Uncharacterized protein n=1 Tax=Puccinia graminis f. sp. tritici TaxID=56615 RepID=A0A5B0MSD1_PUCGR|nr:hypothetical protein PGT21_006576 [Puccinia graminis f. sp. tritici]